MVAAWHRDRLFECRRYRLFIASVTSATESRIDADCYRPVWSPVGRFIACDYSEPWLIKTVDSTTLTVKTLTPDCCSLPAWSPDGRRIANHSIGTYTDGRNVGAGGVYVMNADGTDNHLISRKTDNDTPDRVAWSPTGRTIAFTDGSAVWAVNPNGTNLRKLFPGDSGNTKELAWSPDGRLLAFTHGDGDYEIFVMNADGTGLRNLTDNERIQDDVPSWSSDGRALSFSSNRDGNYEIYVMNAEGSDQTRLTHNDAADRHPTWSPHLAP